GAGPLLVDDDRGLIALHHRHDGVRGAQVDADDLAHGNSPRTLFSPKIQLVLRFPSDPPAGGRDARMVSALTGPSSTPFHPARSTGTSWGRRGRSASPDLHARVGSASQAHRGEPGLF